MPEGQGKMKNKLADLNDHLFAQLERLSDENLTAEQIELETKRGGSIVAIADQIIHNADLTFKAATFVANHGDRFRPALSALIGPVTVEAGEK
jgi:hypothetical protein